MNTTQHPASETKMSKATFMIGGPGSGKSFVAKRDLPGVDVLDCDAIKQLHPDYDPKNPGTVHAWSRKELARAFFAKLGTGDDFVLDGTGTNVERYVLWINQAKEAGYDVSVLYVKTSLPVALARNANRSRVVDESIVREKHATVGIAFDILSTYADNVTVVVND